MNWVLERQGAAGHGRKVHRGGGDGEGGLSTRRGTTGKEEAWAVLATDSLLSARHMGTAHLF